MSGEAERNFCGCCGREISRVVSWCADCIKHVLPVMPPFKILPPEKRTYYAQYGKSCPFWES